MFALLASLLSTFPTVPLCSLERDSQPELALNSSSPSKHVNKLTFRWSRSPLTGIFFARKSINHAMRASSTLPWGLFFSALLHDGFPDEVARRLSSFPFSIVERVLVGMPCAAATSHFFWPLVTARIMSAFSSRVSLFLVGLHVQRARLVVHLLAQVTR